MSAIRSGEGKSPTAPHERAEREGNGGSVGNRRRIAAYPLCQPQSGAQP